MEGRNERARHHMAGLAHPPGAQTSGRKRGAIPIQNIYYLLCYAWDALDEADTIAVTPEQSLTLLDLFARVLVRGTRTLLAHGIDRDYQPHHGAISGVRGKLDVAATVKGVTWSTGHTVCTTDERSVDIPHNRIIKATLGHLAGLPMLVPELSASAAELRRRLHDVRDVPLTAAAFRAVRVHRNNRLYDMLVNVCRLVSDNPFLDETPGTTRFADFTGNRGDMARLFEQFVYHFFLREQRVYTVRRPVIAWHEAYPHEAYPYETHPPGAPTQGADTHTAGAHDRDRSNAYDASDADLAMLPVMRTDVVLTSRQRRIVIDTKYYEHPFQTYRGTRKLRSAHLYQLLSYLQNLSATTGAPVPEGMLLYPTVDEPFCKSYTLLGHRIVVRSVDLSQPWRAIHQALLHAVDIPDAL